MNPSLLLNDSPSVGAAERGTVSRRVWRRVAVTLLPLALLAAVPAHAEEETDGALPPVEDGAASEPREPGSEDSATATTGRRGGDFIDTRITFVFSDDNVFAGPGETLVNSPSPDFGPRDGNFFPFENLDSRDSGQETLSHLVLYRQMPGYIRGLHTEAALVLRTRLYGAGNVSLQDDGSYIRMAIDLGDSGGGRPAVDAGQANAEDDPDRLPRMQAADTNLELVLFPYTSERFRLGYAWDLTWGGRDIFTEVNRRPVPALKLQFNHPALYTFAGIKTTQQVQATDDPTDDGYNELQAFYGFLGGAGVRPVDWATAEVNGGFFQSGTNRKADVEGEPVQTAGVSSRLTIHQGMAPRTSADFRLYRNTPEVFDSFLHRAAPRVDGVAWRVSMEGSMLLQTLGNPDRIGGTTVQRAYAGALSGTIGFGDTQIGLDLLSRSLSYMLVNVPGLDPFNAFSEDSERSPEVLAAISAQHTLRGPRLTPGFLAGVQVPATYQGLLPQVPNQPAQLAGEQVVVVRSADNWELLPTGQEARIIPSMKASLRWDASPMLGVVGQLVGSYDDNQVRLVRDDATGIPRREFRDPLVLGFALLAQARF